MATNPRPPSRRPKAFPWDRSPPQSFVAFIIAAQNRNIVVIPQYPYSIIMPISPGMVDI